jgi:2-keto-4-pentenoate hydratase/2-oxohepta-3-ene-1,7-dioic acid hydratase in catechol pathway
MNHVERVGHVRFGDRELYVSPDGVPREGTLAVVAGDFMSGFSPTGEIVAAAEVVFLPPVRPSKIIGIGTNFPGEEATKKAKYPAFFVKSPSAVIAHQGTVFLPHVFQSVLAEGELGVVLRRRCKDLREADVADAILGYTIVNDLSGRDSFLEVVPAAVQKSADGFAPLGPYVLLRPELRAFAIETRRNGEVVQRGSTADLLFGIVECLCYVTSIMTLEPLDVLATGTPPPKPKLVAGDEVSVTIDGIGTLTNVVR